MANTQARIGYGAQFFMENGAGQMVKIGELIDFNLPNPQVGEVEATHYESPDRMKEFIPGLGDNGEITIATNYIAGSVTDLLIVQARSAGDVRGMKAIVPSNAGDQEFLFSGFIKGYTPTAPINDRQTAEITIRVSGAVTQQAA